MRSDFETLVLPELLDSGLPRPGCNIPLDIDGERLVVDFLWEKQRVVVETDGRETHETSPAFQSDRRRDQFLASAGYRVLRVTWEQIQVERAAVLRRIKNALQG